MLFASVDLKDVYFSVKFLQNIKILSVCFSWEIVWISGSATWVSRFHTYLYQTSKPVLSCLRYLGHSVGIRWWYSLAGRYRTGLSECNDGYLSIFRFLRLHCPLSKSVLQPTQRIEFLEFWLDLVNMIVSLTDRKVKKIRSVCVELLEMEVCSIRHTTDIIGYLVAAHPGVWVCSCVL